MFVTFALSFAENEGRRAVHGNAMRRLLSRRVGFCKQLGLLRENQTATSSQR